ncbi:MAG: hypothetical protein ACJ8FB_06835 [Sphingomicrobium sp.]
MFSDRFRHQVELRSLGRRLDLGALAFWLAGSSEAIFGGVKSVEGRRHELAVLPTPVDRLP